MNKQKKVTKQYDNVLSFPNKVNTLTIFLLVIIYGLFLGIILNVLFPKYDYVVKFNYPEGAYNEEINPYLFVRGTATDQNSDENIIDIKVQYRVFAYIKSTTIPKPTKVRYAYSGLDNSGVMRYFYESSRVGSNLPVSHTIVEQTSYPGNGGFQTYFIKVRYDLVSEEDVTTTKVIEISEDVFNLEPKELDDEKFGSINNLKDIFTIKFTATSEEASYQTNVNLDFTKTSEVFHMNMQSWIITENKEIYPFLGLYNYCTPEDFIPIYKSTVNKYINPEYIYMKLAYTDNNNNVTYMDYKVKFADLIG